MQVESVGTDRKSGVGMMSAHTEANEFTLAMEQASKVAAPYWWIRSFIAVNSLQGFESKPFRQALEEAAKLWGNRPYLPLSEFKSAMARGLIAEPDLKLAARELGVFPEAEHVFQGTTHPVPLSALLYRAFFLEVPESASAARPVTLAGMAQQVLGKPVVADLDHHMITWLAAFLDEGQANWSMPGREQGFYAAWKRLVQYDATLWFRGANGFRTALNALPQSAEDCVRFILTQTKVPPALWGDVLSHHVAALPGWCGFIQMRAKAADDEYSKAYPAQTADYLAVRLFYEWMVAKAALGKNAQEPLDYGAILAKVPLSTLAQAKDERPRLLCLEAGVDWAGLAANDRDLLEVSVKNITSAVQAEVWLRAMELRYRTRLLGKFASLPVDAQIKDYRPSARPDSQLVLCIDVRSEGLRRHLEARGKYETFGFAGFFGVALEYHATFDECTTKQCPVLIQPAFHTHEQIAKPELAEALRKKFEWKTLLKRSLVEVKNTTATAFAFVEIFGAFFALPLIWRNWFGARTKKEIPLGKLRLDASGIFGLPTSKQIDTAEGALRMMGLTRQFAKLVVLGGHGGQTENNPFAASLDCGACGGNSGSVNARFAAQLFNSPVVRKGLLERGIEIPSDTWFLAAKHQTTTDEFEWFDLEELPAGHRSIWETLKRDLAAAGENLVWERFKRFDNHAITKGDASIEARRRADDWSEVRPEWGLAGNAAFIVGPRVLTERADLQCRTFLHSYDHHLDPEGKSLEVILTAPMVVAQWINSQYYFSSVDNHRFGSGNKVLHNVVGKIGVMEGNESDLRVGLPFQSVHSGEKLVHEPMRLLSIVHAPKERIGAILARHGQVRQLLENRWIAMVCIDTDGQKYTYESGEWQSLL
jgi:uncharacterized protein